MKYIWKYDFFKLLLVLLNGGARSRTRDPREVCNFNRITLGQSSYTSRGSRVRLPTPPLSKTINNLKKSYFHIYFISDWNLLTKNKKWLKKMPYNICNWFSKYSRLNRFPPKILIVIHGLFLCQKLPIVKLSLTMFLVF